MELSSREEAGGEKPWEPAVSGVIYKRQIREATIAKALVAELYDESHVAKIIKVAEQFLNSEDYPEYVPIEGPDAGQYVTKPRTFWTCGFLPASLYAVLERRVRFPRYLPVPDAAQGDFCAQVVELCRSWTTALHENSARTDTHDLGFMTIALRQDYELTLRAESLSAVVRAAHNLALRWSESTQCIRSWDISISQSYNITGLDENFLVIIDSMCNLDLLFYVAHITGETSLSDKATSHAKTVLNTLVRPDYSTYHCVNLDPISGTVKHHYTHQGYKESSCWARGQAWAILGFVQVYSWTHQSLFLDAAMSLANYFSLRLSRLTHEAPYVPPWDFGAPVNPGQPVLRDTSAGMIAANGLVLLHQTLHGQSPFLATALRIVEDTLDYSLAPDRAKFDVTEDGKVTVGQVDFAAILTHSTANNNEHALVQYGDHGLVYADYYFLELGNKLLRMGFV